MNILFKQLIICLVLSIILTLINYYNTKDKYKSLMNKYYYKMFMFNFVIINLSFFCGYKLFGDEEIIDNMNGTELEMDITDPGF